MRKFLVIVSLLYYITGLSQNNDPQFVGKNEIKGNVLLFVITPIEITYERIINNDSGIGASIYFVKKGEADITFSFTPFYRAYFGKKRAAGFFIEGFSMLNSGNKGAYTDYDYNTNTNFEVKGVDFTDLAVGFNLGAKWIHKKKFVFEFNAGMGRNLLTSSSPEIVGRGGITLGYRF